jgi:hypothetical protein
MPMMDVPTQPPVVGPGWDVGGPGLVVIGLGSLILIGVLIAFSVWWLEQRRRRDEGASQLQLMLTARLRREPGLTQLPIAPTAVPPLGRGAVRIMVVGQVPSAELRRRALEVIEQEAARTAGAYHIEDNLEVVRGPRG